MRSELLPKEKQDISSIEQLYIIQKRAEIL